MQNTTQIAEIGRKLMDLSENMSLRGLSDAEISRTNRMSSFGDALTRFGTTFGPRTMEEVLKAGGVSMEEAQEFVILAQQ